MLFIIKINIEFIMSDQIFENLDIYYYLLKYFNLKDKLILKSLNKFHLNFISDPFIESVKIANLSANNLSIKNFMETNLFDKACLAGQIKLAKYLINTNIGLVINYDNAFMVSVYNSQINMLKWLGDLTINNSTIEYSFLISCKMSITKIIKKIVYYLNRIISGERFCKLWDMGIEMACIGNNMIGLKYLLKPHLNKSNTSSNFDLIYKICRSKNYVAFKLFYDIYCPKKQFFYYESLFRHVINSDEINNINILDWLYDFFIENKIVNEVDFNSLFSSACVQNRHKQINWIYNKKITITIDVFNYFENSCILNQFELANILYQNNKFDKKSIRKYIIPRLEKIYNIDMLNWLCTITSE